MLRFFSANLCCLVALLFVRKTRAISAELMYMPSANTKTTPMPSDTAISNVTTARVRQSVTLLRSANPVTAVGGSSARSSWLHACDACVPFPSLAPPGTGSPGVSSAGLATKESARAAMATISVMRPRI